MELDDKEVSSFSRSNTGKQLNSDILITFFNEARTPYKYIEFEGLVLRLAWQTLVVKLRCDK